MIGNDIICIAASDVSGVFRNPRYLDKIYGPAEQELILSSPNPGLSHWTCWALKESAYKVWVKHSRTRLFAPKRFVVSALTPKVGIEVETPAGIVYARVVIQNNYISAVASSENSRLQQLYTGIGQFPKTKNPSVAVRQHLFAHLKKLFPFSSIENFVLLKSKEGIPRLYIRGIKQVFDLSLSHHGHFVSHAFTMESYD
ncbi:MAG: 4'-phosphopantetheinyl transferase superfamily protein [Bacteroidia bacterium]